MTFKTIFMYLALAGVSALAISCAAPTQRSQGANTKPIKTVTLPAAEDFSAVGKPTKTIETPWGAREVYDPAQDAEVRAAFYILHDAQRRYHRKFKRYQNRTSLDDFLTTKKIKDDSLSVAHDTVRKAERISAYDFMRIGCARPFNYSLQCTCATRDAFSEKCGDTSSLGSSILTECEENSRPKEFECIATPGPICEFEEHSSPIFKERSIGKKEFGNKDAQFKNYFFRTCRFWHKTENFGD